MSNRIPRDKSNDYSEEMAQQRRDFVSEQTDAGLDHVIVIVSNFQENPELVRTTLDGIGIPPPHVDALEWAAKKDPRYVAQVKA